MAITTNDAISAGITIQLIIAVAAVYPVIACTTKGCVSAVAAVHYIFSVPTEESVTATTAEEPVIINLTGERVRTSIANWSSPPEVVHP